MYTAKITLAKSDKFILSAYGLVDDFQGLLGSLRQNGQILGEEYALIVEDNSVSTLVMLPEKNSLSKKFHNHYVKDLFEHFGLENIEIEIVGKKTGNATSNLIGQSFLILFTHYLALESPLHSGDNFNIVPLYYLPKTKESYHDILSWERQYKACDTLWMSSSVGEKWANKQMADINSVLTKEGLEICQNLYHKTQIPVYYYLHKYYAKSLKAELQRKCPKCGGDWLLDEPLHRIFHFKCDNCYLLSNLAFDVN